MKKYIIILILTVTAVVSCEGFLTITPDDYISDEAVYTDDILAEAAVANIYGRVEWGQNINDSKSYIYLDEACWSNGSPDQTYGFSDDFLRVYDYSLIREINELILGFRSHGRTEKEGELRFLRAWTYFNMARCMGGVPLIGDKVFTYTAGMDVTELQVPRSKEYEIYDYIISECEEVSTMLPEEPSVNGARAVKWTALALKARAALYAASLAKYNSDMDTPISTPGGAVGIPASMAEGYYKTALDAAEKIIESNKYELYKANEDLGQNFYEALSVKSGNKEVIWSMDGIYPGRVTFWSTNNFPTSHAEEESSTNLTPILNLVEAFEYTSDRDGSLKIEDAAGDKILYENPEDLFADKDARLWGTVIYPGATLKGEQVLFQAGIAEPDGTDWVYRSGSAGEKMEDGTLITSVNGPFMTNDGQRNKSGFCVRKYLDETPKASTRQGSGMWFIRFRYAEILMIAAESAMELGRNDEALEYINEVRQRAGIQELTGTLTIDDIIRERRVEFAFEDHRWWDVRRLRIAHVIWDGDDTNPDAVHYALFPYRIYDPGSPDDGKWIFEKVVTHMSAYPRWFQMRNYYNFMDQSWLSNNPKLEKNPYQ